MQLHTWKFLGKGYLYAYFLTPPSSEGGMWLGSGWTSGSGNSSVCIYDNNEQNAAGRTDISNGCHYIRIYNSDTSAHTFSWCASGW